MATITLESVRSFETKQKEVAEAYRAAERLHALVKQLEHLDEMPSTLDYHMDEIREFSLEVKDKLLLIAGEMTDDDGKTAFDV